MLIAGLNYTADRNPPYQTQISPSPITPTQGCWRPPTANTTLGISSTSPEAKDPESHCLITKLHASQHGPRHSCISHEHKAKQLQLTGEEIFHKSLCLIWPVSHHSQEKKRRKNPTEEQSQLEFMMLLDTKNYNSAETPFRPLSLCRQQLPLSFPSRSS